LAQRASWARSCQLVVKQTGADPELAKAALRQVTANQGIAGPAAVDAAVKILVDGPRDAYASVALNEPAAGDVVFQHPYVKSLLELARARIEQEFAKQSGPDADKYLICVRTYGRTGSSRESDVGRLIGATMPNWCRPKRSNLEDKLRKAGLDDLQKVSAALKKSELKDRLRACGETITQNLLEGLRVQAGKPLPEQRLKVAHRGVQDMTLAALSRAMGPKAHQQSLIFVSHEDKEFLEGRYTAALKNTCWADRVVHGIKGAHLQVRFIEEAAPLGTHIIILDDNIEDFVVEHCSKKLEKQLKEQGDSLFLRRKMLPGQWDGPLAGMNLVVTEESEARRFVRGAFPKLKAAELNGLTDALAKAKLEFLPHNLESMRKPSIENLNEALESIGLDKHGISTSRVLDSLRNFAVTKAKKMPNVAKFLQQACSSSMTCHLEPLRIALEREGITGVPELLEALKPQIAGERLLDILRGAGLPGQRKRQLEALRAQARNRLPTRQLLSRKQSQRQVSNTGSAASRSAMGGKGPELAEFIVMAGREMQIHDANIWGVSPTQNHFHLRGAGDSVRFNATKRGIFKNVNTSLGLVYGAFFGFRVRKHEGRYTRFGQVKDDVERSLRYWHHDRIILRFQRYAVSKAHKPGKFMAKKGGISAASSAEAHAAEGTQALQRILEAFGAPYARLAKPGELSSTGIIWQRVAEENLEKHLKRQEQTRKRAAKQMEEEGGGGGFGAEDDKPATEDEVKQCEQML